MADKIIDLKARKAEQDAPIKSMADAYAKLYEEYEQKFEIGGNVFNTAQNTEANTEALLKAADEGKLNPASLIALGFNLRDKARAELQRKADVEEEEKKEA